MQINKKATWLWQPRLLIVIASLAVTACGGSSSNTPNTSNATDISNALFNYLDPNCANYVGQYNSVAQDQSNLASYSGSLKITATDSSCTFETNAIPNHNFNNATGGGFVNAIATQSLSYTIDRNPSTATATTDLTLNIDNAIFLNGIKLDLLAAACYDVGSEPVGSERTGCNQAATPWRYDPLHTGNFGTDSHNAHTQPDGTYHYHGNPNALFNADLPPAIVVGFAADGFPIYGGKILVGDAAVTVTSSWRLKSGARVATGTEIRGQRAPGGNYDGTYLDDYEYREGAGMLDRCNGMVYQGTYGYFITNSYPWVLGCFSGTPNTSFNKPRPG